jgi:hypothetical protein
MSDFIPQSDAEFNIWQQNFIGVLAVNQAALGISAGTIADLQTSGGAFQTDYGSFTTTQNSANAATQLKDTSRSTLENQIREQARIVQANPATTNEMRAQLGITIPDETRTPSPVPPTRPIASIDNRQRLQHTIHFFDESTPNSKRKPDGVRGCEIWNKIGGTAPIDPSELSYIATDTRTPYVLNFDGADAGKMSHYMLRWVNTRGETGPWSETVSVTIGG